MTITPKPLEQINEFVVWMTAVVLSHIVVLGYGWFFVDAFMLMVLAVIYLLLTRRHSYWGEPESLGMTA